MPNILIKNLFNRQIPSLPTDESVLKSIHNEYIDWMHTCGGKGKCTTCKMSVISGLENTSELTENEVKFKTLQKLKADERLACQTQINGDIIIEVCEENKLPHMEYSN